MEATTTTTPPATTRPPALRPVSPLPRRWPAIALAAVGIALLAGAVVWQAVAVPALVKFPDDVDEQLHYEGQFTTYADPATAAPLPQPDEAPLIIDRHVESVTEETGADHVLVRETIVNRPGDLPEATEVHQYVFDRRTHAGVADDRAWAFDERAVLDRSGTFRIVLPRDLSTGDAVTMFKDETAATYVARVTGEPVDAGPIDLVEVEAAATAVPLTQTYLDALDATVPLPRSLTFDQLRPSLAAAGVAVDETLAALTAVATPEDLARLAELVAEPIPLEYVVTFNGRILAEPRTGAIVDVREIVERVGARPVGDGVAELADILGRYATDPTVASAVDALAAMQATPPPVFQYRYVEDRASVAATTDRVADLIDQMELVERTIPLVAVGTGALCVVGAAALTIRRRRAVWR